MSKQYFSLLIKKSFQLQEKKRLFGGADKQKVHRYGHDCPFLLSCLFFFCCLHQGSVMVLVLVVWEIEPFAKSM